LKFFEYEAKDLLRRNGIAIPIGYGAYNSEEAEGIARGIGKPVVLKSQVLVSGRGKSGGIRVASDATEARRIASDLIGSTIKGHRVDSLLVEEKLEIVEQLYASVTIDRYARKHVVLASTSGGVDIEEIAQTNPDAILRYWVDPDVGFSIADAVSMLSPFSMNDNDRRKFATVISILYKIALEHDAELVEINPLVRTPSGQLIAADARLVADDNALFRNPIFREKSFRRGEDTPREAEARKQNLAYVDLDGDIGIIGNGAGLVMATIDLVQLFGGRPGNFLDIGGGAQVEIIKRGVILVMSKPEVRVILINILGGITRCDIVAQGIIEGLNESSIKKPIAVRLMGTNEEEGVRILHQAGINTYPNMEEAAAEVLKL
jgi:succinyl-CoA synthetase beta subunit